MKPKIIAIIPARGGSKGVPHKNIKPLLGKPLVLWTVEQAQKSRLIDTLFVSTDDTEIARLCKKCGVEIPFLRPEEFARDDSPTLDAITHTLSSFEKAGKKFDIIVLLEPTSPLRKSRDIDNAISSFLNHSPDYDALVSVGEIHLENPYAVKKIDNNCVKKIPIGDDVFYQRQQMPKCYFPYGVIYISKIESLKKTGTFYQDKTMPYIIERWQNYEIDDTYDFLCVEAILKEKMNEVVG